VGTPGRRSHLRRGACAVLAAGLLFPSAPCLAEDDDVQVPERSDTVHGIDIAFDALFLRTTGLGVLAAGVGLGVPAAAVAVVNGTEPAKRAIEVFIGKPGRYVFTRPLGDF
jgi:hypothetical protein